MREMIGGRFLTDLFHLLSRLLSSFSLDVRPSVHPSILQISHAFSSLLHSCFLSIASYPSTPLPLASHHASYRCPVRTHDHRSSIAILLSLTRPPPPFEHTYIHIYIHTSTDFPNRIAPTLRGVQEVYRAVFAAWDILIAVVFFSICCLRKTLIAVIFFSFYCLRKILAAVIFFSICCLGKTLAAVPFSIYFLDHFYISFCSKSQGCSIAWVGGNHTSSVG